MRFSNDVDTIKVLVKTSFYAVHDYFIIYIKVT